jgi:3,4-dihydroxy 2-butanone 4-phosphate synthase / GTP cyclohydrolase II
VADRPVVHRVADARLPTEHGAFRCLAFRADAPESAEDTHLALVCGDVAAATEPVLVRVHSECLTGDVFASRRCDCGPQLHAAMAMVAAEGCGVVVYLRGHEGRGIGIAHKLQAYELQDDGLDTVDANLELGLPVDDRDYAVAGAILHELGVGRIRLLTNNPDKTSGLAEQGIVVTARIPLVTAVHEDNAAYLRTKRERMGHLYEID